jgi:hypothetical protein
MTAAGQVQPWRCLTDGSAEHVQLPATRLERRQLVGRLRDLAPGTIVLFSGSAPTAGRRLRLLLRDAPVQVLSRFVVLPTLDAPTCYIADTPPTVRYFVHHILAFPRGRLAPALLSAWKAAGRFGDHASLRLVAPRRLVVARTIRSSESPPASAGLLAAAGMDSVVLALSKDPNAKLTVLLFPVGVAKPVLAVKVPTTVAATHVVEAERLVLETLRRGLPSNLAATLPAVVAVDDAPVSALASTAMAGTPMSTSYHAWRHLASPAAVRADFAAVERWLASFQSATALGLAPCELGAGQERTIRERFADDAHLASGLAALGAVVGRLGGLRLARTAVHGDFWFGNLLMDNGEISGVVDWESASTSGEPLRDLARYALSYALYLDRHSAAGQSVSGHPGLIAGEWGAGISYAIDGRGWFPDVFRGFLQGGLARLGGDPRAWRDVALAGLAEVAVTADHPEFARQHWELFKRLAA